MKKCLSCKADKELSDFHRHKDRSDGLTDRCKSCNNTRSLAAYYANRDQRIGSQKVYAKTAKGQAAQKKASLRFHYGISLEDYEQMLKAQKGKCAICKTSDPGGRWKKSFSVDHNHKTGKVRALLCHGCNAGVGYFKEDLKILESAIVYLREHNET